MKKVLIIANLYHATPRIPGICKYLPQFGWQPTIITPPRNNQPTHTRIIETDGYICHYGKKRATSWLLKPIRPLLKRLYRVIKEFTQYPDSETKWIPHALNAYPHTEHFDAVISSSSPATCHIIAKQLSQRHNLPWIADFRDPWVQNFNYPYSRFRRKREQKLEIETVATANAIVSISDPYSEKIGALHKIPSYTVFNGYDPDDYMGTVPLTRQFTITHTGNMYPELEFKKFEKGFTLSKSSDRPSTKLRFYGPQDTYLPHDEVVQKQRESQILVLLKYKKSDDSYFTGKIYEYLAAQRPIIAVGGNHDCISNLLREANAGYEAYTPNEVAKLLDRLNREYQKYGEVLYHGKIEEIQKYSYVEAARKYAKILGEFA